MSNNGSDIGRPSSLEEQVDTTNTSFGSGGSGNFDSEWDAAAEEGKNEGISVIFYLLRDYNKLIYLLLATIYHFSCTCS